VLILSEMAGAAKELPEAIIVNPNDRREIADALKEALQTPAEEQQARNRLMQRRLRR
jgi:trehalose 6-phosphate synthase/phosphatase